MKRLLAVCTALLVVSGCGPAANNQPCASLKTGDLIITEVMVDPSGADTGNEWFEIYNATGAAIDLKGLTLFASAGDGSGTKTHVVRAGTAQPGAYFTFGDVRSGPNPAWVGYSYNTGLGSFGNSNGAVGLRCGTTELAKYTWLAATRANHSQQLDATVAPSADRAAVASNYCSAPAAVVAYSGDNFGTPGAENAVCDTVQVSTPGKCVEGGVERDVIAPLSGDLVITEVMNRPSTGATTEWIELNARNSFDLNGLKVSNTSGSSKTITGGACLSVNAGDYVVLAASADAGVGLPEPIFVYGTLALADTGAQSLTVSLSDGGVIDVANYNVPAAASGRAQQLDPLVSDSTSNDDPAHFCPGETQWAGGDYGTPGAANATCPVVAQAGQCLDNGTPRAIVSPEPGDAIITEVMGAPTTNANDEWLEVLATAPFDLNGLSLTYGSSTRTISGAACIPVAAGQNVVLAKNAANSANLPVVDYAYGTLSITNSSAGALTLALADGGVVDTVNFDQPISGRSWSLNPATLDETSNDSPLSFCRAQTQWAGVDYGTPGADNDACPVAPDPTLCFDETLDAGRTIVEPNDGALVFTEWMPTPSPTQANREYVEALAKENFDLNAVTLTVNTGRVAFASSSCRPVAAGQYLVFARDTNPATNGGLPALAGALPTTSLTATVTYSFVRADGGVIDTVAGQGQGSGTGKSVQVSLGSENAFDNDDAGARCLATLQWNVDAGSDYGSPGAANEPCPQPGACFDNAIPGFRPVVSPDAGELAFSEWMSNPNEIDDTRGEYVEVAVQSVAAVDLNGLVFSVGATTFPLAQSAYCRPANPGDYLLFARTTDAVVGVTPALTFSQSLTSTSAVSLTINGAPIATTTFAGETAGTSKQVDTSDGGVAVCNTPAGNTYGARLPDGGVSTVNLGTPGSANLVCP